MTWNDEASALMEKTNAAFGTQMTIKHVSNRGYNNTTMKNEKTETGLTVTAIRGQAFTDTYSPASSEVWRRKYTFRYNPTTGKIYGQSTNIDKEDRIVDGADTWAVVGRRIVGNGHGLEVMALRVGTTGG